MPACVSNGEECERASRVQLLSRVFRILLVRKPRRLGSGVYGGFQGIGGRELG